MTERQVEVLPDLPVTDDEVGVEIVFLEPEEPSGDGAPQHALGASVWEPGGWQMKRA